jgi:hypothetical protein
VNLPKIRNMFIIAADQDELVLVELNRGCLEAMSALSECARRGIEGVYSKSSKGGRCRDIINDSFRWNGRVEVKTVEQSHCTGELCKQ